MRGQNFGDDKQWRSQPDNLVPLCKFKVLSLFISLEIYCFHSQSTVNIWIAGPNRRADYATDDKCCHLSVKKSQMSRNVWAATGYDRLSATG